MDISKLLKSFGARPLTMFVPLSNLRFFAGLWLPEPSPVILLSAWGAAFSELVLLALCCDTICQDNTYESSVRVGES